MQVVTEKPPTFNAFVWDGTNQSDFSDNIPGVTTIPQDATLLLVQGSLAVSLKKGDYLVIPASEDSLALAVQVPASDFAGKYTVTQ